MDPRWITLLTLAYLLGSFPSAFVVGKLLRGVDIRQLGNGNSGAANAYRELGFVPGLLVGAADVAKGAASVALANSLVGSPQAALVAGATAVVGHTWPFYLGFWGGRGAATSLGALAALMPQPVGLLLPPALLAARLAGNVTAGFLVLYAPLGLVAWLLGTPGPLVAYAIALPILVIMAHLLNVRRAPGHQAHRPP